MNIIHFFISILPFFLFFTTLALIYNTFQEKKIISKSNSLIFFIAGAMLIILVWYYFPQRNIISDYTVESITMHINGEIITISDENQIDDIKKILNNHTYVRNVNDSLNSTSFDTSNLIRIDYNIQNKDKLRLIHFYIMYPNTINSEQLQLISKSNRLQINEQFYKVNTPYELSNELYNYLINEEYIIL